MAMVPVLNQPFVVVGRMAHDGGSMRQVKLFKPPPAVIQDQSQLTQFIETLGPGSAAATGSR